MDIEKPNSRDPQERVWIVKAMEALYNEKPKMWVSVPKEEKRKFMGI